MAPNATTHLAPFDVFQRAGGVARRWHCPRAPVLPPIRTRSDLGKLLTQLEFHGPAAELGVREGTFTSMLLAKWKYCTEYVQVDKWAHLQNYADRANVKDSKFHVIKMEAKMQLEAKVTRSRGRMRGVQCQNWTTACARNYPDEYFAFVYVDARHDYLGVLHDLQSWWPKLRQGGIMAGHDYTWNVEPRNGPFGKHVTDPHSSKQNWSINFDGSVDPRGRAVKGAVDDFFGGVANHTTAWSPGDLRRCPLQVLVTYRELAWNTWLVAKP